MRQRSVSSCIICAAVVCGAAAVVSAAEQQGARPTTERKATAPVSATATVIPQAKVAEGAITTLDLQAVSPTLTLTTAEGKTWTVAVDTKTTTVWQNAQIAKLDQLKVGDQVRVRYTTKDGKDVAKSIQLVKGNNTAAASSTPSTSSTSTPTPKSY